MENLALQQINCKNCKQDKYPYDFYPKIRSTVLHNVCRDCVNKAKRAGYKKKWGTATGKKWSTCGNWSGN